MGGIKKVKSEKRLAKRIDKFNTLMGKATKAEHLRKPGSLKK